MSKTTRWRTAWRTAVGHAAAGAGHAARVGPGVLGPALVAYGLWLAWAPLGLIALGVFLLLADRRMP
jgi:hypothetical protein